MASTTMKRYWIPRLDIHRKVISSEIQYYLGPDATVRAFTKDGEDGYLIITPGPCLSDEQIDDLCVKSKEMWERQAARALRSESGETQVLKRLLHPPVVISKGSSGSQRRRQEDGPKLSKRGATSRPGHLAKAETDFNDGVIDVQPMSGKHHVAKRINEYSNTNEVSDPAVNTSGSRFQKLLRDRRLKPFFEDTTWNLSSFRVNAEASSTNSGTLVHEGHKSAIQELSEMLLSLHDISNTCLAMLSTISPTKLEAYLDHFLSCFAEELIREADSSTEVSAANFVSQSCKRLAATLVEALSLRHGHEALGVADTTTTTDNDEDSRNRLDHWLKRHGHAVEEERTDQNTEIDDSEIISNLECVKSFIANSKALEKLLDIFQHFPISQGRVGQPDDHCSFDHEEEQHTPNVQASDQMGHNTSTSLHVSKGMVLNPTNGDETVTSEEFQLFDSMQSSEYERDPSTNTPMESDDDSARHQSLLVYSCNRFQFALISLVNHLSALVTTPCPPGRAKVAWNCRCGRRLQLTVPKENEAALLRFIQNTTASGSPIKASSATSDSDGPYERDMSGSSPQALVSISASESDRAITADTNPSSIGSDDEGPQYPDVAAGTRKYLLLCAKSGVHRISLAHIDLTNMSHDEVLFQHIRTEYVRLRGRAARNPFLIPRTMHYIKLQLVFRHISKECVGNFHLDTAESIPPPKHVREGLYTYKPCPVDMPPFPIHPHVFMHSFLYPGDHCGSQIFERLPKKMHCQLSCREDPFQTPVGWGIYIVDGFNWRLLRMLVLSIVFVSCVITVLWSALMKDIQGGTGMGQYAMALLAMSLTVTGLELAYGNLYSCP